MDVGDLLEGHETVWLVRKIEPATKTGFLESTSGELRVVGFDEVEANGFRHLCNPVLDWPSAALPQRSGRIVHVERASIRRPQELIRLRDWVKIDDYQMGGVLYLNPQLGLVFRDRLVVTFTDQQRFPVEIPRDFQSFTVREAERARTRRPPIVKPGPPTVFDHLLRDDDE